MRDIQRGQVVVVAVQLQKAGVLGDVEAGQRVVGAVEAL